ncbi:hypothetical protein DCAR_0519306 [Daucus carota subsp. sativus]|uniref:STAS domain-containing protein n=2 Tax=Daucus carota subsp. sativus TaxID=79200 RepID=A0AAF0X199_DAUCS|nr:hypothetical protein DCAR_0519306 [Daucus carota subsp. sativus]
MTGLNEDHKVSFKPQRSFATIFKSGIKEALFPDDPFSFLKKEPSSLRRAKLAMNYFVPASEWLPKYNLQLFKYDVLAGITIASLAIPQGISYAKLANIPPIIGLYSSFVPPLIYAVFGSSKYVAIGTLAASSLLISSTLEEKVSPTENPDLYLGLVFTATLISGLLQLALGLLRLGILVDFLSHATITGFMGGTATLICLQQLKGIFGLKHFTTHTSIVDVLQAIFSHTNEWRWQSAVVGVIFLVFLLFTRYVKEKRPNLFWVSAIAPMLCVIIGCIFAYFAHAEKHGIEIVGELKRGLNPLSFKDINFDPKYISAPIRAGIITAFIALAEGIAIGRSFAIMNNEQTDGNKEMVAFGLMNIVGSFTSCYLTSGPFSKSAVNYNAGAKTAMTNVVMAFCMLLVLLFLAPLFKYTPLVTLSAIIISAVVGLIDYQKAYHLFKIDKFDFLICMAAFLGVIFISMEMGIMISVGISLMRALLYIARPASCKLGYIPDSMLYRDVEQYPGATGIPGMLLLQLGSPIYFANCSYLRDRILRYIRDEQDISNPQANDIVYVLLDLGGVTSIDTTGVEVLFEIQKNMDAKKMKMILINPRLAVMEKLITGRFIDKIGKKSVFLSVEDAIEACKFSLETLKVTNGENVVNT